MGALSNFRQKVAAAQASERGKAPASTNGHASERSRSAAPARRGASAVPRPPAISSGELDRRREEAARRFAEAHWDLGGLAYEMAVRDHFRLDVLQRQAAQVQELDGELSQLERLRMLEAEGAAGTCPFCATPYGRGAGFCSKCGTQLVETVLAP